MVCSLHAELTILPFLHARIGIGKREKMAFLGLLLVGLLCLGLPVRGYGDGWIDAHATFYGGGDASGTMGIQLILLNRIEFLEVIVHIHI